MARYAVKLISPEFSLEINLIYDSSNKDVIKAKSCYDKEAPSLEIEFRCHRSHNNVNLQPTRLLASFFE